MDFTNKVAIVTGGGSGIGRACVELLSARGARVMIADVNLASAQALAGTIGEAAAAIEVDVADEGGCTAMVAATMIERFGRLDIAVNNAGISSGKAIRLVDMALADYRRVMAINADGVFLSMKAEIPAMLAGGGGSIVNIASIMSGRAVAGRISYVGSKHAVLGLTRGAAIEYAEEGIRVNAVGPGYVDTPMFVNSTAEQRAAAIDRHPMKRLARPEDIANVVAFLASDAAAFVTGACYMADGGYTIL